MNNKGFTLIELIATIALLAVISIISFVSISGVLKQSKVQDCEILVRNIKSATKEYVSDNRYNNSVDLNNILIENLNLTGNLNNPFTNEELTSSDILIDVVLKSDFTVSTVEIKNSLGNVVNCESGEW